MNFRSIFWLSVICVSAATPACASFTFISSLASWQAQYPGAVAYGFENVVTSSSFADVGTSYVTSNGATLFQAQSYSSYNFDNGGSSSSSGGPTPQHNYVLGPGDGNLDFGTGQYLYVYGNSTYAKSGSESYTYYGYFCSFGCGYGQLSSWNGGANPINYSYNDGSTSAQPLSISLQAGVTAVAFSVGQYAGSLSRNITATVTTLSGAHYTVTQSDSASAMAFFGFQDLTDPITSISLSPTITPVSSPSVGSQTSSTFSCTVGGSASTCYDIHNYNYTQASDSSTLVFDNLYVTSDTPVPEPGTIGLSIAGLAVLLALVWRNRGRGVPVGHQVERR